MEVRSVYYEICLMKLVADLNDGDTIFNKSQSSLIKHRFPSKGDHMLSMIELLIG